MTKPNIARVAEDHVDYDKTTGVVKAYVGTKAVDAFRVRILASSIGMYRKTGMIPTRGVTITKMLAMAGEYTGKKYRRGDAAQAEADLKILAAERMADLPATES